MCGSFGVLATLSFSKLPLPSFLQCSVTHAKHSYFKHDESALRTAEVKDVLSPEADKLGKQKATLQPGVLRNGLQTVQLSLHVVPQAAPREL